VPGSVSRLRTVAAVLLGAVALAFLYIAGSWLQVREMGSRTPEGSADAIVVMGAAQYDGRPSDMLQRRLETALEMWNDGRAKWVAVTGGKMEGDRFTEAAASAAWLADRGVPADMILREETGASTWESLLALAPVLRDNGVSSAFVVTTDWHVARSVLTLRELGFGASPASAGPAQGSTARWWREALAVGAGRIIGFGRLYSLTG
jgi:uncharacterized SAM-binding protein YcdF (DUF218 family)